MSKWCAKIISEMRLINVDVDSLEIESFFTKPKPTYAILSHRWGDHEVSFEGYASVKDKIKDQITKPQVDDPTTGISKIAKACLQCSNLKLDYLWIDTCCVDKRSTSEESESINSMFNWYKEAKICLAYLPDTGNGFLKFENSEWFTRGWTLQELLAPRDVTFFDRDWNTLGTKTSRSSEIEKATNIAHRHMIDFKTASIATRMSWQARRQTTRAEDLAYSLFGIFDVGLDLRYGERDKAFKRLQEQIINSHPLDESILAWTSKELGDDKQPGILAPRPDCFKDSAKLTVASPSHKYVPRTTYHLSSKGLEISVRMGTKTRLFFGNGSNDMIFFGEALTRRNKLDVTLNCWKANAEGPATVVIRLQRDNRGFFYRTNCEGLGWARSVDSRTVVGQDHTTPISVKL